jgi:Flp pilus assembly protein TadD/transcriptional regulator with XRE-family HTH domain
MEPGLPPRSSQPADLPDALVEAAARVQTLEDLSGLLRDLRRRHARSRRDSSLTYRELAARTGWSQTAIAEYFTAHTLPPTDRFEALLQVLDAAPAEQRVLASARDRVEETRYRAKNRRSAHHIPTTPGSAKTSALPGMVVPRQLPAAPRMFTGRAVELTRLSGVLDAQPTGGGALVICAIGGTGGVGKTWLALYWAHQNLNRFPDGQLYLNLRGFDPSGRPLTPPTAVRGFLEALGVAPGALPAEPEAQIGLYRSLIAGRRMLIVLDNARDAGQVTPLLPGSATCTVLVTSRRHLGALVTAHGAHALELRVLPEPEAQQVLLAHLGPERLAAEPEAVAELLADCAGLPLALGIVAARAERHPAIPLAALADELRDQSGRLDALDPGDPQTSLRAVLSWSTHALSAAAMAGFALLSLAPGPDITLPAAASLLAQPVGATRALLRELADASLLQQHTLGRYRMHDLARLHATDHADRDHTPAERDAALRRVVDFYTHTAHAADRLLDPRRPHIWLDPPAAGIHPYELPDDPTAIAWFQAEHPNLLATQQTATTHAWHPTVWQLAWALSTFHTRRGHRHDELVLWQAALAAAAHLPDPTARTLAYRFLGRTYAELGRYQTAIEHLHQALTLAEDHHDPGEQARTHQVLARAWEQWGDYQQALEHVIRVVDLYHALDQPTWEADALNAAGWYAAHLGDYDTARARCQAALALHRHRHNPDGAAATLDSLGYIELHTGRHHEAIHLYQQALTLRRGLGNTYYSADTLDRLGHCHATLGQRQQAHTSWHEALELYQELGRDTDAARVRQQLATLDKQ